MPVHIKLKDINEIKRDLGIDPDGPFQQWFTNTCAEHMDKYVPFDEGILAGSVEIGINTITYDQEYASYQYYGMRKDGTHEIVNRTLIYHPLSVPYWDKHMVSAEMQDIEKEAQDFINHGGK